MSVDQTGPIAWMARNGVTPNLLMIVLLVGGFLSSLVIKKEVFPDFDLDLIIITVAYPGGTPEDVEQGLVLAIEEAVTSVNGIEEINSTAAEGLASVTLELDEDADGNAIFQEVQQAVSRITSFPVEAERANVSLAGRKRGVMKIVLYGDVQEHALRELAELVRDQMLSSSGITRVELEGAREYRIHVDVPPEQLQSLGLTLNQIAARIGNSAVDVGGGTLQTQSGDVLVRLTGRRDLASEFADVPVLTTADGASVRLGEIARVEDGFDETTERLTSFEGKSAILLEVFRVGDQTPDGVTHAAEAMLDEIRASLPDGVGIAVLNKRAEIYEQRMRLLLKNAFIGLMVVFVLLTLFLEFKLAFWVTMGIPISFLGAMLFLPSMGASINIVSMFAFIISLGIVVDDAIIAGENIYEYRERGLNFLDAAILGARDIALPVTFSVLTNIVAFSPLLFVPGFVGNIWGVIPLVVISVFAISLVEALFILPAHLAHSKGPRKDSRFYIWQQKFSAGFSNWVITRYQPLVELAVLHRYLSVSIGVSALVVSLAYVASGRMGLTLFPLIESDFAEARATLPVGAPPEQIEAVARALGESAERVIAANGGEALSRGIYVNADKEKVRAQIYLTDADVRPVSTTEVTRLWKEATPPIADASALRFASDAGGPGHGPGLTIELSHRNVAVLERASAELALALEDFPIVSGIDDGFQGGKPQFDVRVLESGQSLGLTARDIASQIRSSFYGAEVLRQQRGRAEVRVLVRLSKENRADIGAIDSLLIRTPTGTFVPLSSVAEIRSTRSFNTIERRAGRRIVQVTADVTPRARANEVLAALQDDVIPQLVRDFPGLSIGLEGRQAEIREAIQALAFGFLAVIVMVYMLLAIPFKSYIQPSIVMAAIPFGMFGAIVGHLLMGYSMSIISIMGVVALSGVVVNDSLVMVHYANQRRSLGDTPYQAIVKSGARRFRPIILTTFSTFGGLAPMIFETSLQARFMIPMAISLGFGILFATAITLLLVPCLYMIVEDVRNFLAPASGMIVEQPVAKD